MFNDFWGWIQERRRNNLEPAPLPLESDFEEEYYTTRPEDMPPFLRYDPRLQTRDTYDQAAHERAKERWAFKEDLRLKGRARLAKLANMKHDLAPGGKVYHASSLIDGVICV